MLSKIDSPSDLNVDRRTLDERVYDRLRLAVMSGVFTPGEVLTLRGLAKEFGTSLMPVRNAVNRLSVEYALEVKPNRSIMLPRLDGKQFDEVTEIRLALEPMAGRLAARNVDATTVKRLAWLAAAMKSARSGDYLKHNMEFHFTLYSFADRPMLEQMIQASWLRVGPLFHSLKAAHPDLPTSNHDWAVNALQQGNAEDTAAAIEADIRDAASILKSFMKVR